MVAGAATSFARFKRFRCCTRCGPIELGARECFPLESEGPLFGSTRSSRRCIRGATGVAGYRESARTIRTKHILRRIESRGIRSLIPVAGNDATLALKTI